MGEASSVKVSDREEFASCNLGDTFKVWSLVYTWRYSLQQDESIGFVVEQWLGKSSGSRRVWSCPQEMGLCEGRAQPFLGHAHRKGTFWAIPVSLSLPKGSLSLMGSWASGEPRERGWAEPNWAQGGIQNLNLQNKQKNKQRYFYCYAIRTPWFVYPQPCSCSLLALPAFEDVPCVPMNNLQTYNTKGMKTDNAIYFALMSLRQW